MKGGVRIETSGWHYDHWNGPFYPEDQPAEEMLAGWAGAFSAWARRGKEVFCFFDNDQRGYAALDAMRLADMLQQ